MGLRKALKRAAKKVKKVFKPITDITNKIWEAGAKAWKTILKPLERPLQKLGRFALRTALAVVTLGTSEIFGYQEDIINFVGNVGNAALKAMREATRGIVTGDFQRTIDAIRGAIPLLVAVGATIVSMGSAAPAAIVMLDAAYNANGLLTRAIEALGKLENALVGTDFIERYTDEIVGALTIVSVAYCGSVLGAELFTSAMDFLGVSEEVVSNLKLLKGANELYEGGKSLYEAYQNQKRYAEEYAEYVRQLQELEAMRKAQKEEFEENLTNFDKWDYFAGGEYFHATFAGNANFEAANLPYIGIFKD